MRAKGACSLAEACILSCRDTAEAPYSRHLMIWVWVTTGMMVWSYVSQRGRVVERLRAIVSICVLKYQTPLLLLQIAIGAELPQARVSCPKP